MEQGQNELTGCAVFAAAPASQPVDSEADLVAAALAESQRDYATPGGASGLRSFGFSAFFPSVCAGSELLSRLAH